MERVVPKLLIVALGLAGCAEVRPTRHAHSAVDRGSVRGPELEVDADRRVDEAERTVDGADRPTDGAPSVSLQRPRRAERRTRIGGEEPPRVLPVSHRRINVDLKGAPLADALRFIADAGGFNLVVEGELAAPVTLKLTGVDAYDALSTLAEAEGLDVEMSRGIVIVGALSRRVASAPR